MEMFKINILLFIVIFFIITLCTIYLIQTLFVILNFNDLPNYVTIIVEINVGLFIAYLIYNISKKQQSKIELAVTKLEKIIDSQEKQKNLRKKSTFLGLEDQLELMDYEIDYAQKFFNTKGKIDPEDDQEFLDKIGSYDTFYKVFRLLILENSQYFDIKILREFELLNQTYQRVYTTLVEHGEFSKSCVALMIINVKESRQLVNEAKKVDTIE